LDVSAAIDLRVVGQNGADSTILSAAATGPVIVVSGGAVMDVEGLVVRDGDTPAAGGGLQVVVGTVTLTDCVVTENQAAAGGGLYVDRSGTVSLVSSTVTANLASSGGGAFLEGGALTCAGGGVDQGVFGNSATSGGGVFLSQGASVVSDLCDWGIGLTDNSPSDVESNAFAESDYGDDASFTCLSGSGCL
jgi:hypothetical protein